MDVYIEHEGQKYKFAEDGLNFDFGHDTHGSYVQLSKGGTLALVPVPKQGERNCDRFTQWRDAMFYYYRCDRHVKNPRASMSEYPSAAFLNWLFAPIDRDKSKRDDTVYGKYTILDSATKCPKAGKYFVLKLDAADPAEAEIVKKTLAYYATLQEGLGRNDYAKGVRDYIELSVKALVDTLKRCPFCKGVAEFIEVTTHCGNNEEYYGQAVRCGECGVQTKAYGSGHRDDEDGRKQAAQAWNRRAD